MCIVGPCDFWLGLLVYLGFFEGNWNLFLRDVKSCGKLHQAYLQDSIGIPTREQTSLNILRDPVCVVFAHMPLATVSLEAKLDSM